MTIRLRFLLLMTICILCANLMEAAEPTVKPSTPPTKNLEFEKLLPDVLAMVGKADAGQMTLKPGDKIAFMGDSITWFGGYVRLTTNILNQAYPNLKPEIINAGRSHEKAEQMEPRFERDMKLADKTAYCFISVGINDVLHRLKADHDPAVLAVYRANVIKMVEKGQAAGATVVLLTPTVITEDPNAEGNKRLSMYVDAMKAIATEKKCQLVDLHAMFLHAIAAKPATLQLTGDGVHMGPYGDAIMAIGVLRALGVPDATIKGADLVSALRVNTYSILRVPTVSKSLPEFAKLLEVPPTRFFQPELVGILSF